MIWTVLCRCTSVRFLSDLDGTIHSDFSAASLKGLSPFVACITFLNSAEQQPAAHQPASLQHRMVAAPAQHAVAAPQPAARPRHQRQGLLQKLIRIPVVLLNIGAQVISSIFKLGVTLTSSVAETVLPQSLQRNLQGELACGYSFVLCALHTLRPAQYVRC